MSEIWKDIPGYEGKYSVSNLGRVWSHLTHRFLKPNTNYSGYHHCCLTNENGKQWYGVHRLVALAFIPNPDNKPTVNHINENKDDNRVENLEWATFHEQNVHGTRCSRVAEKMPVKPVEKMDLCDVVICRYASIGEAARNENIRSENLVKCLKGRRNTCGGFKWKYA